MQAEPTATYGAYQKDNEPMLLIVSTPVREVLQYGILPGSPTKLLSCQGMTVLQVIKECFEISVQQSSLMVKCCAPSSFSWIMARTATNSSLNKLVLSSEDPCVRKT